MVQSDEEDNFEEEEESSSATESSSSEEEEGGFAGIAAVMGEENYSIPDDTDGAEVPNMPSNAGLMSADPPSLLADKLPCSANVLGALYRDWSHDRIPHPPLGIKRTRSQLRRGSISHKVSSKDLTLGGE